MDFYNQLFSQETARVQDLAATAAASLHLPAADFIALVDKSLPTAAGLAGQHLPQASKT